MRTTPRVLKATEKYIASIGKRREELTEEQWNLMLNYIKGRRISIPLLIIVALILISSSFWYWHLGHKYFTNAIPSNSVTISFVDQQEPISLSPKEIKEYFNRVIQCYAMAWGGFLVVSMLLTFLICFVIIGHPAHRILLFRPTTTGPVI